MVFVKKGMVVPLGNTGDFDDERTFISAVIKHAGRFFLYYVGYDGSNFSLGLATSKDGVTFLKKGVVIPVGSAGDFDDHRAYYPAVIKHAGRFFLYYVGYDGSNYRIGLATSKDGVTFVKKGVVIPLGSVGDFDDVRTHSSAVIKHAGRFFLYYSGYNGSQYRIGLATSKDGVTFLKKGVAIPVGSAGDFDDHHLYYPGVIKHAGRFFLYYTAFDASKYRVGLATSKDGVTFVKKGVVIPLGSVGDFDDQYVYGRTLIKHAGRFFFYYAGYDGSNYRIGLAISKNGL